jgi:uracil-DNA glycosylase
VCRCAPPDNKPTSQEIASCLSYLRCEIALLSDLCVIVALGRIAFDNILRLYAIQQSTLTLRQFGHGAIFSLAPPITLIASYHPSRQNTQTGRLTPAMFDSIWNTARGRLELKRRV